MLGLASTQVQVQAVFSSDISQHSCGDQGISENLQSDLAF